MLTRQQLYQRFFGHDPNEIDQALFRLADLRLVYLFNDEVELSPLGRMWAATREGSGE
jgi:hypothetical protein